MRKRAPEAANRASGDGMRRRPAPRRGFTAVGQHSLCGNKLPRATSVPEVGERLGRAIASLAGNCTALLLVPERLVLRAQGGSSSSEPT